MTRALYVLAVLCIAQGARIHKSANEEGQAAVHAFSRVHAEEPAEVTACRSKVTKADIAKCMCGSVNGKGLTESDLFDACAEVKAETKQLASNWECAVRVTGASSRCIVTDKENGPAEEIDEQEPAEEERQAPVPIDSFKAAAGECKKTHGRAHGGYNTAACITNLANGKGLSNDEVKDRCAALRNRKHGWAIMKAMPWSCSLLVTNGKTRCVPFHPFRRTPASKPIDVIITDGGNSPAVEEKQASDDPKNDDDLLDDLDDLEDEEEEILAVDCEGSFAEWSACSKPCGSGTRTRKFTISTQPDGGNACPADETEDCNEQECAIDCAGSWPEWGECPSACGGGTQTREYAVTTPADHGGKACPAAQSQKCNEQPCPVDCAGAWGDYGACSKPCGTGQQSRSFSVTTQAAHGGDACPAVLREEQPCNTNGCPVNCAGSFGAWGSCSEQCGGGSQSRSYDATTPAAFGGTACPASPESQDCNTHECAVHCEGSWGAWSACSKVCGGGTQTRNYATTTASAHGGQQCPVSPATRPCNAQACPIDCVSTWGSWGACSKKCGGGTQTRSITVSLQTANGGKACPASPISQACNTHECPVDCTGRMGGWSSCSKGCGGGTKTQVFHVKTPTKAGGKACPVAGGTQTCNTHACPINCDWGWSGWSTCSKQCGAGTQSRSINIRRHGANGGNACPASPESRNCNTHACACHHTATSFNSDGGGNAVYFDRHALNCGNRKMTRWRLIRDGWHQKIRFLYSCCDTPSSGGCSWRSTRLNDDGDGDSVYLDRHDVRCNSNEALQYWRLNRGPGQSAGWGTRRRTIKVDYKCCHTPNQGRCHSRSTRLNADGGGNTVYFDRHDLSCPSNEVMQRWHLNRMGTHNRVRFDYTCCR